MSYLPEIREEDLVHEYNNYRCESIKQCGEKTEGERMVIGWKRCDHFYPPDLFVETEKYITDKACAMVNGMRNIYYVYEKARKGIRRIMARFDRGGHQLLK